MDLEGVTLSEVSQITKTKTILYVCGILKQRKKKREKFSEKEKKITDL